MSKEGIYLHIPFCVKKCPYCDFYSLSAQQEQMEQFTQKTVELIAECSLSLQPDTFYFGGGTPTALGAERLVRILQALQHRFGGTQREVTLEANPGTVSLQDLQKLRQAGFDRISLGIQSGREEELQLLGRIHTLEQAKAAVDHSRQAGFANISVDMMMGLPEQSISQAIQSAEVLMEMRPDHISAYLLKLEEGTPFGQRFFQGEPEQEQQAEIYTQVCALLESQGYHRYEISNFAHKGKEAIHNTKYWRLVDYLGIGPSAHSCLAGKRYFIPSSLEAYLQGENLTSLMVQDGESGGFDEYIMLGLRMTEGISLTKLEHRYPHCKKTLLQKAEPMLAKGLMGQQQGRLFLQREGFLLSNAIIARLL